MHYLQFIRSYSERRLVGGEPYAFVYLLPSLNTSDLIYCKLSISTMLSNQLAYSVLPVCTTFDVLEASVYNVRTFDPDNYVPPIDEASSPFLYMESS